MHINTYTTRVITYSNKEVEKVKKMLKKLLKTWELCDYEIDTIPQEEDNSISLMKN